MRILMLIFFVFVSSLLHAQRDLEVSSSDPKRIALVIGNGAYQYGNPLTNTLNDADAITRTLQGVGFDVIKVKNASLQELETKLNEFTTRIESGNYAVALCFYSGHGIQVGGENYLIPVDANPQREADVKYQCLNAQQIIDHMSEARAATKIMLLDACRNNPLPKTWNRSGGKGLAYMFAPRGTFIGFATAPGTEASDGIGNNSPYTSAILKYLNTPGLDIHQVFTRVAFQTEELAAKEGKTQTPYISSNLTGDFYFVRSKTKPEDPVEPDSDNDGIPDHRDDCPYKAGVASQKGCPEESNPETITDALAGTFVLVKGGSFDMGSNNGESDEKPVHRVTLSDYYIGQTEVTQAQWEAVMGSNPSYFSSCDECPVEQVSWNDIQKFLQKLNNRSGGGKYRLPTEAEWEYAARGGARSKGYSYAGSNNIDEVAWYNSNSGSKTRAVGSKQVNELGLYDMTGNVWEWCGDWYGSDYYASSPTSNPTGPSTGSSRVIRGGSWLYSPQRCRVADRLGSTPDGRDYILGFRLARAVSF